MKLTFLFLLIANISFCQSPYGDWYATLKAANLPPWKEDWEEFITQYGIDCFKLHGREDMMRLKESMDIVERWSKNETMLFSDFEKYTEDIGLGDKPIDMWREKIKTCKFDCWKCNYCESVYESRLKRKNVEYNPKIEHILMSIDNAINLENRISHFFNCLFFRL